MTAGVESPDLQRRHNWRLILAALLPVVAGGLQGLFWEAIQPFVWFLFYPAVFFSSWVGGLRGGLVATVLSTVLVWYCFIPPQFSFAVQRPMAFLSIAIFMGMGVLFSLFHGRLRMANQQAVEALAAARLAKDELEAQILKRTAEELRVVVARDSSDSQQSSGKTEYEPYFTKQNPIPDRVR
jgi:K+-sensing histidine kinase KdpD